MQENRQDGLELNGAESAEMAVISDVLRADLARAAQRPDHFWTRQRTRVKERLTGARPSLRTPIAAMAALAALSFALLAARPGQAPPPPRAQAVDADDLLLKDIQHSLSDQAPEPLMPASVLVQEMTTTSTEEKRDN